jgi:agmatinase
MNRKEKKIREFNPNGIGQNNGQLFGLPFNLEESNVIIIPVPWDVTASYGEGASLGPASILSASDQIDFFSEDYPDFWKEGVAMCPISPKISGMNKELRQIAKICISYQEKGRKNLNGMIRYYLKLINQGGEYLNSWVESQASKYLKKEKLVGVLGGDHSCSLGLMQALAEHYSEFGVLHIDAHLDLRMGYENFDYSHASAMLNAFGIDQIERFVHAGVRDFCQSERDFVQTQQGMMGGRSVIFSYDQIAKQTYQGFSWESLCEDIICHLPALVYISFDIDGLDPSLCPNTGTPVPGGLSFYQAFHLIRKIAESKRRIIGFDLCEVAPASANPETWKSDWNAVVGMRVLYWLAYLAAKSRL